MAGETHKTEGIVLQIRPWSRTSHIVTWLTPDHGPVATLVKGAVRPKSPFLGQYDLFYTCDILYYARAHGELHPLRETVPRELRTPLRGRWRATALAGYAADLVRELAPTNDEAREWFDFLTRVLDELAAEAAPGDLMRTLVHLEMGVLARAGLAPDLARLDFTAGWAPFAIDNGRGGEGRRTVRLSAGVAAALRGAVHGDTVGAVRFLGHFLAYHLDRPVEGRRTLAALLAAPGQPAVSDRSTQD